MIYNSHFASHNTLFFKNTGLSLSSGGQGFPLVTMKVLVRGCQKVLK